MKNLYIIRGLPGSGKSTFAKTLPGVHFEADDYFMHSGVYMFNAKKLPEAHEMCQWQVEVAMLNDHETISVANTFTTRKEMQPYRDLAEKYGYTVVVIKCDGNYGSVHGVPASAIERMRARWEEV